MTYYDSSLNFVLDLMRKLSPANNSTEIIFAKDEEPIFDRIGEILSESYDCTVEFKDTYGILNLKWGNGKFPTKQRFFTRYYEMSEDLNKMRDQIKTGRKIKDYDREL